MAARARRILDERAKSASVRRLFACGYRRPAQDNAAGETFYDKHRPAARGPARTDAPRDHPGRADYAALHRGERLPGARKSVVSGKRVSVRVDLGGRRIIKKKQLNIYR